LLEAWRAKRKLPVDPLAAHRAQGYEAKAAADRKARREALGLAGGSRYA
jgi:L-rhamnose isomerase